MSKFPVLLGVLALAAGCHLPTYESSRTVSQTIETQPLTSLDLSTFNGGLDIQAHDQDTIEMEITYTARGESEDAAAANCDQLDCEISADNGRLIVMAVKPSQHWTSSASFNLRVPANCELKLQTSNGKVQVSDMLAGVEAHTSNGTMNFVRIEGDVVAKTSNGTITLERVNGSIDLTTSNGKVLYAGNLVGNNNEIRTSNGRVTIQLPTDTLTEVDSRTSNGKIKCLFETQRVLDEGKRDFHAIVGESDLSGTTAELKVKTSNGSITIEPLGEGDTIAETEAEIETEYLQL